MIRLCVLLLPLAIATTVNAQSLNCQNLASNILGFENNSRAGITPTGWSASAGIVTDSAVVHSGQYSARIDRTASSPSTFSTVSLYLPIDFAGQTVQWRGFLKWENVGGFVALWLREDGETSSVAFDTLQLQNLNGTRDWTEYTISVPVRPDGKALVFGFLLNGPGRAWVDDLQLLVDGEPAQRRISCLDTSIFTTDREFDAGSKINLSNLTDAQIRNLATLGKVWGFLKYHHPAVTSGSRHWDYDLFRIVPAVLNAGDAMSANAAVLTWIQGLGAVEPCNPCATLVSSDLALPVRPTSLTPSTLWY